MWPISTFRVRKHERGLLFRDSDFQRFLEPGTYRFFDARLRYYAERFDMSRPVFDHRLADYLMKAQAETVARQLEKVETGNREAALVFYNERPADVLGPAECKLYWKGLVSIRVERFDLAKDPELDVSVARRLLAGSGEKPVGFAENAVYLRVVPDGHVGLLYIDGELVRALDVGLHAFWRYERRIAVEVIDLRARTLEVTGQEILTRDKVSLRINLSTTYQFEDPVRAVRAVKEPLDHLYKEIQFALRAAVGTRTLDTLLEDKSAVDRAVAEQIAGHFREIGIAVRSVGLKDIILPGEMKTLLSRVVEAEKAAQANVIRRREETNATRSLLNTAKVMDSNPVALRLKELETLEKVTEKIGNLSVYGGLDSVLDNLVRLKR